MKDCTWACAELFLLLLCTVSIHHHVGKRESKSSFIMVLVAKFWVCVMIFVLKECGVVPSVHCVCVSVLVSLHV